MFYKQPRSSGNDEPTTTRTMIRRTKLRLSESKQDQNEEHKVLVAARPGGPGRGGGWQSSGRGEIKAWNTTEVWSQTGENAIGAGVAAPRASLPSEVAALLRGVRDMCRC